MGTALQAYNVHFENLPSAGAWAQRIQIVDVLPLAADARTVRLNEINVGGQTLTLGDLGGQSTTGRFRLTTNGGDLFCDVSSRVDLANQRIIWTLQAIDPATGEPPVSSQVGLLPPEDGTGRGQGYVSYTVRARRDARTGDLLENSATITFDQEEPITTNTWVNTLDAGKPSSRVSPIVSTKGASFRLAWSGEDDAGGSGIASYDVFVSRNDGPYELWLSNTLDTSAVFDGALGFTYSFYSRARDNVGNYEDAPLEPDAVVDTVQFGPGGTLTPSVTGFDPGQAQAGGASFKLKVNGRNFQGGSYVLWDGERRPTVWRSATELEVDVSSVLIENPGDVQIVVVNPETRTGPERRSRPRVFRIVP